jgi:hypothetical protein
MIQIDDLVIPIWLSWHGMQMRTKQVNGDDRPVGLNPHSPTRFQPERFSLS